MKPSITKQITALLAQSAQVFAEFMKGLAGIRREREQIVKELLLEEDAKKIQQLKNRITKL